MAVFTIDNAAKSNNHYYGYYGKNPNSLITESLSLGSQNFSYGSKVIDSDTTDKSLPSGQFAFNNPRPICSRQTDTLSGSVNNNILSHMSNPTQPSDEYPHQDLFGPEYTLQYIYSNNPKKDKIGVF